jgi:PKD repeat protein
MRWNRPFFKAMAIALGFLLTLLFCVMHSSLATEEVPYIGEEASELTLDLVAPDSVPDEIFDLQDNGVTDLAASASAGRDLLGETVGGNDTAWVSLLLGSEEELTASISAQPTKGTAPLEVQFAALASGGSPPYAFWWDLNNDGTGDDTRESFLHHFIQYGEYPVTLTVKDAEDHSASASVTIKVQLAPTVAASATPLSGAAPLNVSFSASAQDGDGTIVLYEWDFNGDGTYEYSSKKTPATTYKYLKKGSYKATIRVTDNSGLKGTDVVVIEVGTAPVAKAAANPASGLAPLTVNFVGTGTDADGKIALYQWDFDGDGVYDWQSDSGGNATHTYNSYGSFYATFRVTDNNGLTGTAAVFISVSGAPVSLPGAYPTSGDVPLKVTFFTNGQDLDGSPEYYDWDYDGNGIYDEQYLTSVNATYTYNKAGTYNATLKVTDNTGMVGIASVPITVTDPNPEGKPTAVAEAVPTNGGRPLMVALNGRGSDRDGVIVKYEWDFEGDGVYDWQEKAKAAGTLGTMIDAAYSNAPIFGDLDGDGDLDLLVGNYYGTVIFYRNDGNKKGPAWTLVGPLKDAGGNTINVGYNSIPALADVDGDGDLDLLIGAYSGTISFYRNTGSKTAPEWTYVGLLTDAGGATIDVGWNSAPALADLDGDGKLDLVIGEYYGTVVYYHNTGKKTAPQWTLVGPLADAAASTVDAGYTSIPTFADIDGDGDLDLFLGNSEGVVITYQNTGSVTAPQWTLVGSMTDGSGTAIDVGYNSCPRFVDINNDGVKDLFIGEYYGKIAAYANTGTSSAPVWKLASSKYDYLGVDSYSAPALADIDGDGDFDLFIGENYGKIAFYKNQGSVAAPSWLSMGFLSDAADSTISVGYSAVPAFADLDGDGDQDLLIGNSEGTIVYYQNTGSNTVPRWTLVGPLADAGGNTIDVGSNSAPVFADLDGDGDLDLLMGEYYGTVVFYRNDGTKTAPKWTYVGPLKDVVGNTVDAAYRSRPAVSDVDRDGNLDLLIGGYYGKVFYYRNSGNTAAPVWSLYSSEYLGINTQYNATPTVVDIDGDGDDDLFVGGYYGSILFYPTVGCTKHLYENMGTFPATLRVTDNNGLTATDAVSIRVFAIGSPTALAIAQPTTGAVPLQVSFSGKGTDPNGVIAKYEWDFDGDGVYDWSSTSSPNTSFTYNKVGDFTATLRVTDNDGKKATDSVLISPTLGLSSTRTSSFDPTVGEKAKICSSTTDDAKVVVRIVDGSGKVVKVLASNQSRTKGKEYCDEWDGLNKSGKGVADGVYYYTIEYTINGETFLYDLRKTAQYVQESPYRTFSSTFNPYEEKYVEVTYPLSKPSEVSLYFWIRDYSRPNTIAPVRTPFIREPQAEGSHKVIWDGVDDRGVVVDPGEYPVTIRTYPLPDNAVIVKGNRPVISAVGAEPNYLNPVYNPYSTQGVSQTSVTFSLSKKANVEVRIINAKGVVVRTLYKPNMEAGANAILWDGKDQGGNLVTAGAYSIGLSAVDSVGNRSFLSHAAVVVSD